MFSEEKSCIDSSQHNGLISDVIYGVPRILKKIL